jgi:SAM-dependent methyltransferase
MDRVTDGAMADRLFTEPALAELYDRWAPAPQRGDFGFYLPLVMSAGSVLDIGCGTGELLRLARQAGHTGRLCGLDPAPAMLALARQRPDIEWVLGEAASAAWRQQFDLVVMTGHAFQVLVSDDEIRAALAAVRAALATGGRFAFETRNPAARAWEDWIPGNAVRVTGPAGAVVTMAHQVVVPFDGATVTFTSTYTSPDWARPEISRSTLRFLNPGELAAFLSGAGLAIHEQFGDWDRAPLTRASPEIITIAGVAGQD